MAEMDAARPRKPRARKAPDEARADTPDPVELAMAAASSGKPLPDAARNVLEKHARLIDCQIGEFRLRKIGESVRAALWAILAVAAFGVVILLGAVLVSATRADALIVQSFRVPPSLEAKGLTGEVVATQVLDKLAGMQEGTESARAASTYANNWEDDLKIDIPNTGATTDQVWKLLRGWLGKETRISGEVIDLGDGLALTARVGAKPGQRFVSADRDLDALVAQGAELIFKRTQPYRYAVYVGRIPEREAERYDLLMALTSDPSRVERKWAFSGLAYDRRVMGFFADSARMAESALAIDPHLTPALGNLAQAQLLMGHDQAAMDGMEKEAESRNSDQYDARINAANRCARLTTTGYVKRNPVMLEQGIACLAQAPGSYTQYVDEYRATAASLRRDPGPGLAYRARPMTGETPEVSAGSAASLRLESEKLRGPSPALDAALADHVTAGARRDVQRPFYANSAPVSSWPFQADALSMLGRHAQAQALIGRTPLDCYDCVRIRGLVAKRSGDPVAAQRWFSVAVRQGPSLPAAFSDWGTLLLDARRYRSAEVKLREASRLAPNWADPLKSWGDLLAAQGKREEALAKYDAALRLAPKWVGLRKARDAVAARRPA